MLGQLRNDLGRPPVHEGPYRYVWIVDFPMFVGVDENGRPKPAHHPFTTPHPDDVDLLETDPMAVRSRAYDLVLNGWELGSGSIRIHDSALQRRVFAVLGIGEEEADRKFGFFLQPFEYGAPPHGGFAFGLDRLVAILAGEENIREVIAFPKTQSGTDPMTSSPLPVDLIAAGRARHPRRAAAIVSKLAHRAASSSVAGAVGASRPVRSSCLDPRSGGTRSSSTSRGRGPKRSGCSSVRSLAAVR